ncbi:unnamed protein product [Ectocarpus sp. CCAP 1310/34]|nr:unnamed protein product [Ectocarpus sp. CCAP 1310/34]
MLMRRERGCTALQVAERSAKRAKAEKALREEEARLALVEAQKVSQELQAAKSRLAKKNKKKQKRGIGNDTAASAESKLLAPAQKGLKQQQEGEKQQSTGRLQEDTPKRINTASADIRAGPSIVPAITNAGEGGSEMNRDDMVVPVGLEGEVDNENVGVIPGLALDILSLTKIQDRHEIELNRHGASILAGRVRMTEFPLGSYIHGTRVDPLPQGDSPPQPPAMVAAMLRPGSQSSIDYNALHCSLGHANSKTLYETARQMGIKVTGTPEHCDGCAKSKAIQRSVPKFISSSRRTTRPLERVAMDLAGPFGKSSGGANGTNVVATFRAWCASIKSLLATHGGLGCVLTDNGTEWVNAEFRGLLAELNITRELTAVDGPKSNRRVERRIVQVMDGGKAAFLEFPKLFPGVSFPTKALSFRAMWPEALAWMNDCLAIAAEVSKEDKRCPEVKLYGRRRIRLLLPFMMPGFRHRHRPSKMHSKGERCFYLNSGQDHSCTTHKIITPARVPTYSEHCTFDFSCQDFRGDGCSWGSVAGMTGGPAVAAGATASAAASAATAATSGGSFTPASAAGRMAGGPAVAAGAAASAEAPAATAATSGGSVPPATAAGGMAGVPAVAAGAAAGAAASAAAPAAAAGGMAGVPAVAAGAEAAAETPAATEQRQHEHMTEPESMVESGAARNAVLARMAGGPSRVSTPAAPVATPAPAHSAAAPLTSDGLWTEMVHEGGTGGRWQGQREFVVTPTVTRSWAKRDGPGPGMLALLATEDETKRSIVELPAPGVAEPALSTGLVCDLDTPETHGEAHAGPNHHIWTNAERKEFSGALVMFAGACVMYLCRTKKSVTLSSTKAEYVAMSDGMIEDIFLRYLWRYSLGT